MTNMAIGISTACFYPDTTENSLLTTAKLSAGVSEIFFNSPHELDKPFIKNLKEIISSYDLKIKSFHPYASFAESYYYFSSYERRFYESLDDFKRYFYAAAELGAEIIVIHGIKLPGSISDELYFDRFSQMYDIGKKEGVFIAQENVVHYRSESPEFLKKMKNYMGNDFKMVFDIKQARRANYDVYDFINEFYSSIIHTHISDFNSEHDCITPLSGNFDFNKLFTTMKSKGYTGDYIIELYQNSYKNKEEIKNAKLELEKIL
ncbi:MAG: sugar phosphate isomerase/epimerase [Oscillospiraceae bacterium]